MINLGAVQRAHKHFLNGQARVIDRTLHEQGREAIAHLAASPPGFVHRTGRLMRSTKYRVAGRRLVLRSTAKHAEYIERGRGPVVAKRGRALRFVIGGRVLFRKRVKAARAYRFLSGARDRAAERASAQLTQRLSQLAAAF